MMIVRPRILLSAALLLTVAASPVAAQQDQHQHSGQQQEQEQQEAQHGSGAGMMGMHGGAMQSAMERMHESMSGGSRVTRTSTSPR
jgi:hypothetical protein